MYALGAVVFAVHTFLLTPKRSASPCDSYGYHEFPCAAEAGSDGEEKATLQTADQVDVSLIDDSESLKECLTKMYTWTGFLHYAVSCFSATWFSTSFNTWIATKLVHEDQTRLYTTVYGIISGCAVLVAPCVGLATDKLRGARARLLGVGILRQRGLSLATLMLRVRSHRGVRWTRSAAPVPAHHRRASIFRR